MRRVKVDPTEILEEIGTAAILNYLATKNIGELLEYEGKHNECGGHVWRGFNGMERIEYCTGWDNFEAKHMRAIVLIASEENT